ncbi:MAG TPA: hypothetical protein VGE07_02940, partial [Herpetosiphonaceae bacterium]
MRRLLANRTALGLLALTLLALALRLLAWGWNAARPLGGDEREYLDLAIHLAQGKGYYDLQFMRPPLFPAGLAALVWLFDGDLPLLRLANALVSAATVPLVFWWTRELGAAWGAAPGAPWAAAWRRAAWWAAGLAALSYTLALNATELLTETVFLAGLTVCFALLARAGRTLAPRRILGAGAALGLLCLIRSVALPLGLLGAAWLILLAWRGARPRARALLPGLLLLAGLLLPVLPWTARNAARYGGFILIDTTGQENLWLDNDPRGRDVVKAELYAMGERRIERAGLASQRGLAAIAADPGWVAAKAWREFGRFWALEQADDLSQRRAIWLPAAEVWLRLALGDGLWLLVLLAGAWGLAALPNAPGTAGLRALLALWAAYTVFTGALFHVELRYRLPLFPVLLPAAGWILALAAARLARRWRRLGDWLSGRSAIVVARPASAAQQHSAPAQADQPGAARRTQSQGQADQPNAAAPTLGGPQADQPGAAAHPGEPGADRPNAAGRDAGQPGADQPGAAGEDSAPAQADQPNAAAPTLGGPQADQPGAASHPGEVQADQPNAAGRDAGEPGADRRGAARGWRALAARAL